MLRRALWPALLICVTLLFYWKLAFTGQYIWFDHPDMCYIELPRLEFQAREMHLGRFPLWDPHIWTGQPLIGQTQPGPLYPLNLLFLLLPLRDGHLRWDLLNLYYVFLHALAALACYALCRELRRTRPASLLAACAFSFGGFLGSVPWLDVMNGALFTPLVALFFLRALRRQRPIANAAFSGFFLGLAWLSGHHEIPILVSSALALAWLAAVIRRPTVRLAPAAVTFLIAGLIGAAQIWPTTEFARLSKRWAGVTEPLAWNETVPYLSAAVYSLTPRGLLGIALPGQGAIADTTPFAGILTFALALLAVVTLWRHPATRYLSLVAGLAIVFALGAFTPFHGTLYSLLPVLDKARMPVRAFHLLNLALAVLAAFGVDRLLGRRSRLRIFRISLVFGAIGALLAGAAAFGLLADQAIVLSALAALAFPAVVAAWHARKITATATVAILLIALLAELSTAVAIFPNQHAEGGFRFARHLVGSNTLAAFLHREPPPHRVRVNDQDIPTNFGDLHSINMQEGYTAGVTSNLLQYGRHTPGAQRLFAITHYVGKQPDRPGLIAVFEDENRITGFRVPQPAPRAWAVHAAETVPSPAHLAARIDDPGFDPYARVLLTGPAPSLETCPAAPVTVESYAPNRVRLGAKLACRGMVILADTHYPGWQAKVDGKPADIWEAYGSLRGVVAPAGQHQIEFHYRPVSVFGGIGLTALGCLLTLAALVATTAQNDIRNSR